MFALITPVRTVLVATVIFMLGFAIAAPAQTTWYVDDDAPNDPGPGDPNVSDPDEDGSPEHPFDAIQEGIDAAQDGDTVLVLDGTYTGDGNRDLDFGGKLITVRSENGPESCIIDCDGTEDDPHRGFYFHSGETTQSVVDGFTIINGYTSGAGGGIYTPYSSPTVVNCTFSGNMAYYDGGGICNNYESSPTVTNCTFTGNSADGGGGMYNNGGSPTVTNCILWGNSPSEVAGNTDVTYSDVHGGWPGEGNIDADPLFAFADDLHLMAGSPCIDAGTNDPPGGLPPDDLDGNSRPLDGDGDLNAVADMGAYEYNPESPSIALSPGRFEFLALQGGPNPDDQVLSIRNCGGGTLNWETAEASDWLTLTPSSGDSTGEVDEVSVHADIDGLTRDQYVYLVFVSGDQAPNSPRQVVVILNVYSILHVPSEYPTIQAAIDAAVVPGDIVLVADGIYTGAGNKDLDFGGKAITVRSENGPDNCIIDCEGTDDDPHRGFHFQSGETATSILDGFTITNGYASHAAGVRCSGSSPTITNCTITGNSGRGVYCDSDSSPTITNCAITHNGSAASGGGVHCGFETTISGCTIADNTEVGVSCASEATIANCTITGNSGKGVSCGSGSSPTITDCTIADNMGPGVRCYQGSRPSITNCTISGNTSYYGGGVYCDAGNPTITNCVIAGNTASHGGGGVHCDGSVLSITDCTVSGNWTSEGDGGGIYYSSGGSPSITNCTITGNMADRGGGVYCGGPENSDWTISDCIISGNFAMGIFEGNGAGLYFDADLGTVVNCVFGDNTAVNDGGGIYCGNGSPAIINCTVSHNFAFFYGGGIVTCSSQPRVRNCVFWDDSGALGSEIALLGSGDELRVAYCDIRGGQSGAHVSDGATLIWGLGNIQSDPVFLDPNVSDYHLSAGSPCIDAGDNYVVNVDTDLDGNPRFVDDPNTPDTGMGTPPIVDMGAYEYQGTSCAGDLDGDGDTDHSDLGILLADWGCVGSEPGDCVGDLDGDFDTDHSDLGILLADWGCGA